MFAGARRAFVTFAALMLASSVARAEQFVLFDITFTCPDRQCPKGTYTTQQIQLSKGLPGDLTKPVDYTQGTAHFAFQVLEKPSAAAAAIRMILTGTPASGQNGYYVGTTNSPAYTKVGVYQWSMKFQDIIAYERLDYTKGWGGGHDIHLMGGDKDVADQGDPNGLYMPTRIRMVVTFVSPGGTYVPPPFAPVPDGGADAGKADVARRDTAASRPPSDAGARDSSEDSRPSPPDVDEPEPPAAEQQPRGCSLGRTKVDDTCLPPLLAVLLLPAAARKFSGRRRCPRPASRLPDDRPPSPGSASRSRPA